MQNNISEVSSSVTDSSDQEKIKSAVDAAKIIIDGIPKVAGRRQWAENETEIFKIFEIYKEIKHIISKWGFAEKIGMAGSGFNNWFSKWEIKQKELNKKIPNSQSTGGAPSPLRKTSHPIVERKNSDGGRTLEVPRPFPSGSVFHFQNVTSTGDIIVKELQFRKVEFGTDEHRNLISMIRLKQTLFDRPPAEKSETQQSPKQGAHVFIEEITNKGDIILKMVSFKTVLSGTEEHKVLVSNLRVKDRL